MPARVDRPAPLNPDVGDKQMTQLIAGLALIALAAILGFYGAQLARTGLTEISGESTQVADATSRPYVFVQNARLEIPHEPSVPVRVSFDLRNTGTMAVSGFFKDFTYYFSTDPEQRAFLYGDAAESMFSLAPSELQGAYFFPSFVMSSEKLAALNAGAARLFFYAKGQYEDDQGNTYDLPFAQMYHPAVNGNLVICPDDISFK